MAVEVFPRLGTDGLIHRGIYDFDPERPLLMRGPVNVGRAERWLSMAAGAALATYGFTKRSAPGGMAALAGAALFYRGVTGHCDVYQSLGIDRTGRGNGQSANGKGTGMIADRDSDTRQKLGGSRGIHVEESVVVDRPLSEVYRFWRNLENLPRFMKHLESVTACGPGLTHWVARGPAGMNVEWDARIINEREDELIGWQSLEGSTIATAGSVRFDEEGDSTRVNVHLQYHPPGGKLGSAVARLFGEEPSQAVREDMWRFKRLLEIRSN